MDLFKAIERGHEDDVSRLLDAHPNLLETHNHADAREYRFWPLAWAAFNGRLSMWRLLVQRGANIHATDDLGRTALYWAARDGHEEMVAFLLRREARVDIGHEHGFTPIIAAATSGHLGIVKMLVPHTGAHNRRRQGLDNTDHQGRTALCCAAENGHEKVVAFLLSQGASANIRDVPLVQAATSGHLGVVKMLVQHIVQQPGAPPANNRRRLGLDQRDRQGRTPLDCAAANGHEEIVTFLLSQGVQVDTRDAENFAPLASAIEKGHLGVVKILLQHMGGQGWDEPDAGRRAALHCAASMGHEEMVAFLLSQGARAYIGDEDVRTPLKSAAMEGHLGVVKMLVKHMEGQGLDKTDYQGRTALWCAAERGHEEMVAYLLSQGARAVIKDKDGRTPLISAAYGGRLGVVKMLVKHMEGQGLDKTDYQGRTALYWASRNGHEEIVTFLASQGARADIGDEFGWTPLMVAAKNGDIPAAKMLVKHMEGQGLDERDGWGRTALDYAADKGRKDMVRALLLAGADPTSTNMRLTPGAIALYFQRQRCMEVFNWWEGELERRSFLQRAWCLHDAFMTHQAEPTAAVPGFLQARATAGQALPQVEVLSRQHQETPQAGASNKEGAASEAGSTEKGEEADAVLAHVVMQLDGQLFTELMQCFHHGGK